jgi:hypothetical protein
MDGRKEGRKKGGDPYVSDFYVININVVMNLIFIENGELHNNEKLTMCLSLKTKLPKAAKSTVYVDIPWFYAVAV